MNQSANARAAGRRWDAVLLLGVALAVRCGYWFYLRGVDPLFLWPIIDERTYDAMSTGLLQEGWVGWHQMLPFWQPPGYTFLLAALKGIGLGLDGIVILQWAAGCVNTLLVFTLARKLAGHRATWLPLLAALVFTCHPSVLYYETRFLKPVWNMTLLLVLMSAMLSKRRRAGLLAGATLAVMILFESYFALLLPLLFFSFRPARVRTLAACLIPPVVVLVCLCAVNSRAAGRLVFISNNGAANLFVGNNPDWVQTYNTLPGWTWRRLMHRHDEGGEHTLAAVVQDRFFLDEVLAFMRGSPGSFLQGLALKTAMLCSPRGLPRDGAGTEILPGMPGMTILFNLLLLAGVVPAVRAAWRGHRVLLAVMVLLAGINIVFFPTTRFRLPLVPLLCVALGSGLWWHGGGHAGKNRWVRMLCPGLLLAVAGYVVADDMVDYAAWRAFSFTEAGKRALVRQAPEEARDWLDRALAEAEILPAMLARGQFAFEVERKPHVAARWFHACLEQEPDYPDPYFYLGLLALADARRLDDAKTFFQLYLVRRDALFYGDHVDPDKLARALLYYVLLETRRGATPAGRKAWERALRLREISPSLRERIQKLGTRFETVHGLENPSAAASRVACGRWRLTTRGG